METLDVIDQKGEVGVWNDMNIPVFVTGNTPVEVIESSDQLVLETVYRTPDVGNQSRFAFAFGTDKVAVGEVVGYHAHLLFVGESPSAGEDGTWSFDARVATTQRRRVDDEIIVAVATAAETDESK